MRKHKYLIHQIILIVLAVVLTVGLSEQFYRKMIDSETEKCWEELSTAHSEAAREISIRLQANTKMLDLASDAIFLNADFRDEETVRTYLASVREETIFDRIDVVFPDGSILLQSTGERIEDNGEKTYEELIAKGSHLSQRVPDFLTGQPAVHAFSPVYSMQGEPIAILGATVYCSTLGDLFASAHYGENAQLFLVDLRDGNIILDKWHTEPGNIYDLRGYELPAEYNDSDIIADLMAGKTGQLAYPSQNFGETAYTIFAPVEGTNFSLTMVVQEHVVLASVYEMKARLMWVGAVEMLVLIFFALWIYHSTKKSKKSENRAQQAEFALLLRKEQELESQYAAAAKRREFLEVMAVNLPGGYHRCTTDHSFRLTFISKSFTQITGYTMEQVQQELDGSYMGIVAPEDRERFLSLAPMLERDGFVHCAYRIRRRDGQLCWVQDSTQYVERDGEQYYQCALMDISDQVEELEQAKRKAETSSQAKSTFLFNISHDIRTPMNAINGFSHIIEENADNPALVLETAGKIKQAGNSLLMLMNDVLDISRIERGREEINLKPMNLYEHGKNLYEMFASEMQAAGIHFMAGGDQLQDVVYCDELKLTRIMMNMLSNARKFTPAGGTVTFGGTRLNRNEESCTYRFFVRDTGIGMSAEFQKRAFQQFERERTSTQSGISGSGLGLAIIKVMAELMGGTVELQSELGRGTEIAAILTFRLADSEMVRQTQNQNQSMPDMSGKRVLLVEDNEFNREIARYILEGMKFTVEEAENGAVCISKLRAAQPGYYDAILMDIQMPVMDGYTAAIEIRNLADRQLAQIPIVAMTANAFSEDKQRCLEVGMNGHIAKPIDVPSLMKMLSNVL